MNPCFLTTFVLIVELTEGKRSSRWRKRNKPRLKGPGFDPAFSRGNCQSLDPKESFGFIVPAMNVGAF